MKYQKGFIGVTLGVYIFMAAFMTTAIIKDEIGDRQVAEQSK